MRVNVYTHERDQGRTPLVLAYTRYQGPGACIHEIFAVSGTEAKRGAIAEHRLKCLGGALPGLAQPALPAEPMTAAPGYSCEDIEE